MATNPDLDRLITDLDARIPQLMDEAAVPGLSIALISEGKLSWQKGFGVKNVSTSEAVNQDTIFEAASLSKPIFAYATLKLCEKGLKSF